MSVMNQVTVLIFFIWCSLSMESVMARQKYRVTTVLDTPYAQYGKDGKTIEGLVPDLLKKMETILDVDMEITLQEDNRYGALSNDGNWSGMIGNLVANKSDIAAAGLTATSMRAKHIELSHSFVDVGLRIIVKKPSKTPQVVDNASMFFRPFQAGVWISIIVAYLLVAVTLYIIKRTSPEEEMKSEEDNNLSNSVMGILSMLSVPGYHSAPSSVAGRILVCFWWIFAVIAVVSYTASLAAELFMKYPSVQQPLHFYTFRQLADQTTYKYGTFKYGSTRHYFRTSPGETEKIMNRYFDSNDNVLTMSNSEGIRRVRSDNYAFIMESETAYYLASQYPCDLTVTGESLGDRSYNFACRNDSSICTRLNQAILQLKESGELKKIRNMWMDGPCGTYETLSSNKQNPPPTVSDIIGSRQIDLRRFTVPLCMMAVGIIISGIATGVEFLLFKRNGGVLTKHRLPEDKRSFGNVAAGTG